MNILQKQFNDFIYNNNVADAEKLLYQNPNDINLNYVDNTGYSLLKNSIFFNRSESILFLLKKGASTEIKDNLGWTPLMAAINKKDTSTINLLLEYNANVNVFDNYNNSALYKALESQDIEIFTLITKSVDKIYIPYMSIYLLIYVDSNLYINQVADVLYQYQEKIANIQDIKGLFEKLGRHNQLEEIATKLIENSPEIEDDKAIQALFTQLSLHKTSVYKKIEDSTKPHTNLEWINNQLRIETPQKPNFFTTVLSKILTKVGAIDFLESIGGKIINSENFSNMLDSLEANETFKELLDIAAIHFINHPKSKFYLVNKMEKYTGKDETHLGHYNADSNETILQMDLFVNDLKGTLIHEFGHLAMQDVFCNKYKPYFSKDKVSAKAYGIAIYKSLENIYKYLFHKESPVFDTSYELGKAIIEYSEYLAPDLLNPGINIIFEDKEIYQNHSFFNSFLYVYDTKSYEEKKEESEFIVRYEEQVASGAKKELLNLLKPLKEYMDNFVKPVMQDYIAHQPSSHMLICSLDEYSEPTYELIDNTYSNSSLNLSYEFGDIA